MALSIQYQLAAPSPSRSTAPTASSTSSLITSVMSELLYFFLTLLLLSWNLPVCFLRAKFSFVKVFKLSRPILLLASDSDTIFSSQLFCIRARPTIFVSDHYCPPAKPRFLASAPNMTRQYLNWTPNQPSTSAFRHHDYVRPAAQTSQ